MLNIYLVPAEIKSTLLFKKCFFIFISFLVIFIPLKSTAAIMPFINEFHYDNQGADLNEFIEIAGLVNTNITSWQLYLYNGSNKQIYKTYSLTGKTFLNSQNGYGFISIVTNGIQNGAPDGIALANARGKIIQFISYEGVFSIQYQDQHNNTHTITSIDIGVSESNHTNKKSSLQLSGKGSVYSDFKWQNIDQNTADSINTNQKFTTFSSVPEPSSNFLFFSSLLCLFFTKKYSYYRHNDNNINTFNK